MKRALMSKLLILCVFVLLATGCSEVAISGRKQFNIVPGSTMNSMSFKSYGEFLSQNKLSTDAEKTRMVKRAGARIQKAVEDYSANRFGNQGCRHLVRVHLGYDIGIYLSFRQ